MGSVVVVLSGGLDSTTVLYRLRADGYAVAALAVNYGQRHARELAAARAVCHRAGVPLKVVDLTGLAPLFAGSALTDDAATLPDGPYSDASIAATTVPNRNMILLSVALGWAAATGADAVAFGAHHNPAANYPDCSPAFAEAMDRAAQVCADRPLRVLAPYIRATKAEVVADGVRLGVPFELTWSCYRGGDRPCGVCGTCTDRREAFRANGLADPTDTPAGGE